MLFAGLGERTFLTRPALLFPFLTALTFLLEFDH